MSEEEYHVTTNLTSIANTTNAGFNDPWQRPSSSMRDGSKAQQGAEWREEQMRGFSRSSTIDSDSSIGAAYGMGG